MVIPLPKYVSVSGPAPPQHHIQNQPKSDDGKVAKYVA